MSTADTTRRVVDPSQGVLLITNSSPFVIMVPQNPVLTSKAPILRLSGLGFKGWVEDNPKP